MLPLRDSVPSRSFPVVTYAIIAANAAVFFFELSLGERALQRLFYEYGLVPVLYAAPQAFPDARTLDFLLPPVTSMFLHGGWMHFLGNMWTLHIFGDNVEDEFGKARYILFPASRRAPCRWG
jgi:membrane associated rhomboid family serine protease